MIGGHVNVNYLKGLIILCKIHYDMAIRVNILPGDFKNYPRVEKESHTGWSSIIMSYYSFSNTVKVN